MENHSGISEVMYEYFCIVPGEVGGGGRGIAVSFWDWAVLVIRTAGG